MKTTIYEVIPRGTRWWVACGIWEDGPFADQQEALDSAFRLARVARAKGCHANVKVRHDPDHRTASSRSGGSGGNVMIWTLGGGVS